MQFLQLPTWKRGLLALTVVVGISVSVVLNVFASIPTDCPVDVSLYLLAGLAVTNSSLFVCWYADTYYSVDPMAFPKGDLYPNEWAWRNRDQVPRLLLKRSIWDIRGLKYILLFCQSVMGINLPWLIIWTSVNCTIGSLRSAIYWIAATIFGLVALIQLIHLVRQGLADIKSYKRFRQMTAISSEYKSVRVLWQHLLDPAQVLSQKIGLMSHIPWGSPKCTDFHFEIIRKAFSWTILSKEEHLFRERRVNCVICDQNLKETELCIMFPVYQLTLHEQHNKPEELSIQILKKIRQMESLSCM